MDTIIGNIASGASPSQEDFRVFETLDGDEGLNAYLESPRAKAGQTIKLKDAITDEYNSYIIQGSNGAYTYTPIFNDVLTKGKNLISLINRSATVQGVTYKIIDNKITVTGKNTDQDKNSILVINFNPAIELEAGETGNDYTFSISQALDSKLFNGSVFFYYGDDSSEGGSDDSSEGDSFVQLRGNGTTTKSTLTVDSKKFVTRMDISVPKGAAVNASFYLQIEQGNEKTDYTFPYKIKDDLIPVTIAEKSYVDEEINTTTEYIDGFEVEKVEVTLTLSDDRTYINKSGEIVTPTDLNINPTHSNKFDVISGETLTVTSKFGWSAPMLIYYDSSQNFIGYQFTKDSKVLHYVEEDIIVGAPDSTELIEGKTRADIKFAVINSLDKNNCLVKRSITKTMELNLSKDNKYINTSGAPANFTNSTHSDKFSVVSGGVLVVTSKFGALAPLLVYYDSSKKFIGYQFERSTFTTYENVNIIVGDSESTELKQGKSQKDIRYAVINSLDSTICSVCQPKVVTVKDKIKQIIKPTEVLDNPFGKKMYVDGDSIMFGYNYDGEKKTDVGYSVGEYMCNKYGMALTKRAVTGSTLATETGESSIYERFTSLVGDEGYDIIVFDGGINDNRLSVTVGDISESFLNFDSATTTIGALERICRILVTKFPDAKKLFVVTHEPTIYQTQYTPANLIRNTAYLERMSKCIEVCHKWGILVLDMTKSELKISDNNVMLGRYFHKDDTDTPDNEEDIIHPNEKGYNIYGREVERALFFGNLLDQTNRINYYTKSDIDTLIANLNSEITNLNSKIADLESELTNQ